VKHNVGKEFNCDPRTLGAEIYCSVRGDDCNETTNDGVFFRHIECQHKNPFWNPTKSVVEVPGRAEETSVVFQLDFSLNRDQAIKVQHWLLGVLRLVPQESPEMWFPAMLLRATAETSSLWKRVGVLVELAGAREAGKTILAMMSMNKHGYTFVNGSSHEVQVRDFTYSSHKNEGELRRFIETLHLSTLLDDGRRSGLFLPQGTYRSRNLKVAFIKPSRNWQVPTEDNVDDDLGWPKKITMKALFTVPNLVKGFFNQTVLVFWQVLRTSNNYPFWYTVVFYDTAGEANEDKDMQRELAAIDKVAILVNAGEIFGAAKEDGVADKKSSASDEVEENDNSDTEDAIEGQSIRTACDRIAKGVDRKQKLYLVVTQMDRIKELIKDDWERVEIIADGIGSKKLNREAKDLFIKWLSRSPAQNANDLRNKLRFVKGVFFVWTEALPKSYAPAGRQSQMPQSRGLAKFICDCLDVKMSQITQLK
jgi:hypothetical protein